MLSRKKIKYEYTMFVHLWLLDWFWTLRSLTHGRISIVAICHFWVTIVLVRLRPSSLTEGCLQFAQLEPLIVSVTKEAARNFRHSSCSSIMVSVQLDLGDVRVVRHSVCRHDPFRQPRPIRKLPLPTRCQSSASNSSSGFGGLKYFPNCGHAWNSW